MLLLCTPVESDVLFGEVIEGSGNLSELSYEASVEVGKSKESLDIP